MHIKGLSFTKMLVNVRKKVRSPHSLCRRSERAKLLPVTLASQQPPCLPVTRNALSSEWGFGVVIMQYFFFFVQVKFQGVLHPTTPAERLHIPRAALISAQKGRQPFLLQ